MTSLLYCDDVIRHNDEDVFQDYIHHQSSYVVIIKSRSPYRFILFRWSAQICIVY